jgi:hypothetical protein
MATIRFFSNYEFEKDEEGLIIQDSACKIAYEDDVYSEIVFRVPQVAILETACKEQIKINHDILIASLHPEDQMSRLVDMLERILGGASDLAKNLDSTAISKIVERLGKVDDKSIIDAVIEKLPESASSDKPKSKRGRKSGSKNKSHADKIVHIPGRLNVDDIITET